MPVFSYEEKTNIYVKLNSLEGMEFNACELIERVAYEVGTEKNGFKAKIKSDCLRDAYLCIPIEKSEQLAKQEGAFYVCGLLDEVFGTGKNKISEHRLKDEDAKTLVFVIKK